MRKVWLLLLLSWVIPSVDVAAAQKPPVPPPAPPEDAAPADRAGSAPPPPPAAPTPDGRVPQGRPQRARRGDVVGRAALRRAATQKAVTITTNDNSWGKLRATVTSRAYGFSPLNIDALPIVLADGRVRCC